MSCLHYALLPVVCQVTQRLTVLVPGNRQGAAVLIIARGGPGCGPRLARHHSAPQIKASCCADRVIGRLPVADECCRPLQRENLSVELTQRPRRTPGNVSAGKPGSFGFNTSKAATRRCDDSWWGSMRVFDRRPAVGACLAWTTAPTRVQPNVRLDRRGDRKALPRIGYS